MAQNTMAIGVVKWFDCRKGYGFLVDGRGREVFVHYKIIEGSGFRKLIDGESVEFEAEEGDKGIHATAVRRCAPKDSVTRTGAPVGHS